MKHFTDACRVEKIKCLDTILGLVESEMPSTNDGSEIHSEYENSISILLPGSGPAIIMPDTYHSGCFDGSFSKRYNAVNLNRYFGILDVVKGIDVIRPEDILYIGKLVDSERSSKIRKTPVFLKSSKGIDKEIIFPDEERVTGYLVNLCNYVNDNPDNLDRVELAAAFAFGFCRVHPFADGNGRTSRLMANLFLTEGEHFKPLPQNRGDYRRACGDIDLSGNLDSMYLYFYERLDSQKKAS